MVGKARVQVRAPALSSSHPSVEHDEGVSAATTVARDQKTPVPARSPKSLETADMALVVAAVSNRENALRVGYGIVTSEGCKCCSGAAQALSGFSPLLSTKGARTKGSPAKPSRSCQNIQDTCCRP